MPQTCKRPARSDGRERLFALMVEEARFRDRLSFGSDGNHAKTLGVSRTTIFRWKCQLESDGRIERDGYHVWGPRCRTVRWKINGLRVTQRSSSRRTYTPKGVRTKRYVVTDAFGCATKRGEMSEIEPHQPGGIIRADGSITPPNAGDAVALVVDWFAMKGIPVTRQAKGMVARQSKTLLEDGFDFNTVVTAAILAIRRGGPQLMHFIATDLVAARAGEWIPDRNEYRKKLEDEIELRRETTDDFVKEEGGVENIVEKYGPIIDRMVEEAG